MLYVLFRVAILILPFVALIVPLKGLRRRTFWKAFALQFVLMIVWAVLGGVVVGQLWWRLSGGCAGNGGSFEGACGYAGVAQTAVAGFATTVVMTAICGILLRHWIKRRVAR